MTERLADALARAIDRRGPWLAELAPAETDCVRLLAGTIEGTEGVTVDRYGPLLLIQTGRQPLDPATPGELARVVTRSLGCTLEPVWNHRPAFRRGGFDRFFEAPPIVHDAIGREEGLSFVVDPRHGGLDPLLFLDLRAGRRLVRGVAAGKRALNLFAYTCGLGVAAAAGGAREVVNVDFARSALTFGAINALLNGARGPRFRLVHEDAIPIVRQRAGLPIKGRGARRDFLRGRARRVELVMLDPPRWAKTPFGAVDLVRDYPSLLKPAMLCLEPGGLLLATHHVPSVTRTELARVVSRTAEKAGRRVSELEVVGPDPDFPSPEGGEPALKIALARVD